MATAADDNHGAAANDGDAPTEIRNLPALIGETPAPPVPTERMQAAPQDAFERFAFALWTAGRKDEALELIERQIARERAGRTAAAAVPPAWTLTRPLIAGAAALVLVGVLWTGFDRIAALPQWLTSAQPAAQEAEARSGAPAAPAEAELAAADDAEAEPLPAAAKDSYGETLALAAAPEAVDTADSADAPAADRSAEAQAGPAAAPGRHPDSRSRPDTASDPETASQNEAAPPPETVASVGISDQARAEGGGAPPPQDSSSDTASADPAPIPAPAEPGPVTLRTLADRDAAPPEDAALQQAASLQDLAAPRLPRARPEPSPALVARLTAPEPQRAAPRRTAGVGQGSYDDTEPYVVPPPPPSPYEPERYADAERTDGLTIIGRVDEVPPELVHRRAQAERYIARRRALAERHAPPGGWQGDPWPPVEDPYAPYGASPYSAPQVPWVRRVPGGYVIGGY